MERLEELREWVNVLTPAEKRFITLLGKARAGLNGSQHLAMFEWLCQNAPGEELPQPFLQNFSSVNRRLKELISDSLRLLHKDHFSELRLHAQTDQIALLLQRGMNAAARRLVKRTHLQAIEACRYEVAMQCLTFMRKLEIEGGRHDMPQKLAALNAAESQIFMLMQNQQELRRRHDEMRSIVWRTTGKRDPDTEKKVWELTQAALVEESWNSGRWLERALAGNILGMKEFFEQKFESVYLRYRTLLEEWNAQPGWQMDESAHFLLLCKNYQNACFIYSKSPEEMEQNLALLPGFAHLPPQLAQHYQHMIYSSRLALLLTSANFSLLPGIKQEIMAWLEQELPKLGEVKAIPMLFNLAVTEFFNENFSGANQLVMQILQLPNRKAREDVRNFCRVFQSILHYELGNENLNEFLIRSGKRHFTKNSFEDQFELSVLRALEKIALASDTGKQKIALNELSSELVALSSAMAGNTLPIGFMEVRLWVKSRQEGMSLRKVYERMAWNKEEGD